MSASLSISLGPISGGVGIDVGASVSAHRGPGGGSDTLSLTVFLQIWGEVNVLGIVSAYILIRLSGTYEPRILTGTGELHISIKICWCFTIEVNQSISYSIGTREANTTGMAPGLAPPVIVAGNLPGGDAGDAQIDGGAWDAAGAEAGPAGPSGCPQLCAQAPGFLTQFTRDYIAMLEE